MSHVAKLETEAWLAGFGLRKFIMLAVSRHRYTSEVSEHEHEQGVAYPRIPVSLVRSRGFGRVTLFFVIWGGEGD